MHSLPAIADIEDGLVIGSQLQHVTQSESERLSVRWRMLYHCAPAKIEVAVVGVDNQIVRDFTV